MKREWLKKILLVAKILITVLFVYMVNRTVSFKEIFQNSAITVPVIVVTLLFSALMQFLMVLRWHYSLRYFGSAVTLKQSATSYFAGSVLAAITPGRAGELLRGLTLDDVSKIESSFIVMFERFIAIGVLFITGAVFTYFLPENFIGSTEASGHYVPKLDIVVPTVRVLGIISLFAILLVPRFLSFVIRRFIGKGKYSLIVIILSLFIHGFLLMQTAYLLQACGIVTFSEGLTVGAESYSAMQLIPITIGNMGIRESYFQLFAMTYTALSAEELKIAALTASLTIMFSNLILPAFPGLFVFFTYHLKNKDVRKIGNN